MSLMLSGCAYSPLAFCLSCASCPPCSVNSDCSYEVWTSMLLQPASSKNPENPFTTGGIILFLELVCRSHSTAFSQLFFLSFLSLAIFCQNHHAMLLPASSMQQCKKHTRSAQLPDGGMGRLSLKIKLLKYLPF